MRPLRLALWLAVAIALFGLGALSVGLVGQNGSRSVGDASGLATPESAEPLGGRFNLVDHTGAPVTEAILRGKPSAVFFGFTYCPDVCPTALMEASGWIGELGAAAEKLRVVFVTVDPERDTPEVMRRYLSAFSDKIIGITGEPEAVRAMVKDHKIFSQKVALDGDDYTLDHSAAVLLLDRNGSLVGTISRDEDRATAMAKLTRLVAG